MDSYFANASFIKPLMEKGIAVISRLRKDAVGWDDTPEYSGRGRPRKREDYQATTTTAIFRGGSSAALLFASGNRFFKIPRGHRTLKKIEDEYEPIFRIVA